MRYPLIAALLAIALPAPIALAQSATATTLSVTYGNTVATTVKEGTEITLTAKVTVGGASAAPPGQVDFCVVGAAPLRCTDIRLLGLVQLSAAGTATFNFYPGPGTHTYQAVFLGTHILAASSSSPSALVVTPFYPTVTTIASSGSPGDYTLTATVTSTGGTVPPAGTMSFLDTTNANYILAAAPLVPVPATVGFQFESATPPDRTLYQWRSCGGRLQRRWQAGPASNG